MKALLLISAAVIVMTASIQAQSWSFSLGDGIGFSYGSFQHRIVENSAYYAPLQNFAPQQQSYSYVTPPVYVKTDLDKPPVIMQRVVTYGNSSRDCGPYPNRW